MGENKSKTFITGATGDIGSQVVALSQASKTPIRALCRRQAQIDKFESQGVEAVLGNLDDSVEALTQHMKGCNTLLLITAAIPNHYEQMTKAIDSAIAAGVKWIIKISASDARDNCNVPWATAHAAADRHLESRATENRVSWTILKPSGFMQAFLDSAPAIQKGFLPQTTLNGRAGWIDTTDIAAVCHQVMIDGSSSHDGRSYILTGPELASMPEIAEAFSREVGHHVRYLHLPTPLFRLLLRLGGADTWTVNGVIAQFAEIVRPNKEGVDVSAAVEKITGKPATSISQFARRNKEQFKGTDIAPYLMATAVASVAAVTYTIFG